MSTLDPGLILSEAAIQAASPLQLALIIVYAQEVTSIMQPAEWYILKKYISILHITPFGSHTFAYA